MNNVILTGFEPIFGIKRTPSGDLVKTLLQNSVILPSAATYHGLVLPQVFRESFSKLKPSIEYRNADKLIMFGASANADRITLEKFAVNIEHSREGDNSRIPVYHRPIIPGGPDAYSTDYNLKYLMDSMPSDLTISYHAGTHTCNSLYYESLHYVKSLKRPVDCIFVHVPFTPDYGTLTSRSIYNNFNEMVGKVVQLLNIL